MAGTGAGTLPDLATPQDLAGRLKTTVPADAESQQAWYDALTDASAELRGVIGQAITRTTATISLHADGDGLIRVPLVPLRDVTAVVDHHGTALVSGRDWYRVGDQAVRIGLGPCRQAVRVTVDFGYDVVPAELVKWTCVLAAGQLATVEAQGNLGMSPVTSIRTDDGQVNFRADESAPVIPVTVAERLRASYGGVW